MTTSSNRITINNEPSIPAEAYKNPATPGPIMEPNCQKELFQVAALAKTSLGTKKGFKEDAAGLKNLWTNQLKK